VLFLGILHGDRLLLEGYANRVPRRHTQSRGNLRQEEPLGQRELRRLDSHQFRVVGSHLSDSLGNSSSRALKNSLH